MAEISTMCLARQIRTLSISTPRSTVIGAAKLSTSLGRCGSRPKILHTLGSCEISRRQPHFIRSFTTTSKRDDWLTPKRPEVSKSRVGRPRMPTGGSMRGTTVVWGEYGLRMKDHDRRVSAKQLKIGEDTIRRRLRGMHYKLYKRVSANIGVYTKGNEVRMGKGKGKFDYWAARIPVSRIIFEVQGDLHEKVVRDAFRLAGHKLPGLYEFVKKGDPPVVGLTKLGNGVTLQTLKEAKRPVEAKDAEAQPIIPAMTNSPPQTVSTSL